MLISIICIAYIFFSIDIEAFQKALAGIDISLLFFGVVSLTLGYFCRIYRWQILLGIEGKGLPFRKVASAFLCSIALNNVMPMRAGDVVRALIFPSSLGISRAHSAGSIFMERILDILIITVFFGGAAWALGYTESIDGFAQGSLLAGSMIVAFLAVLTFFRKTILAVFQAFHTRQYRGRFGVFLSLIAEIGERFLLSTFGMLRPVVFFPCLVGSVMIWLCEAGLFFFVLASFLPAADYYVALLIMAMATLATMVPSSPGYIGPFHLAAVAGITLAGGNMETAAAYALITHGLLWATTTTAGMLAMAFDRDLWRSLNLSSFYKKK